VSFIDFVMQGYVFYVSTECTDVTLLSVEWGCAHQVFSRWYDKWKVWYWVSVVILLVLSVV